MRKRSTRSAANTPWCGPPMVRNFLLALLLTLLPLTATAHEVRPAYLEITETPSHQVNVLWKRPINGEIAVRLVPHLSSGWLDQAPDSVDRAPAFLIAQWHNLEGDLAS